MFGPIGITRRVRLAAVAATALLAGAASVSAGQQPPSRQSTRKPAVPPTPVILKEPVPHLVVLIVVDQMRADYVDKFRNEQWRGGLRRLVDRGAWFRNAAYPYARTETCVGHATISTGAFPATHGLIANSWWDRESQKMVTCTSDAKAKNVGYAGAAAKGGDSAWRMELPSFAEELKLQTNGPTRIATFSLKARSAIPMAGHKADAVVWFDGGGWVTSDTYGTAPFVEEYAGKHPIKADYGKTWSLSLPESEYWYESKALGAVPPPGWDLSFPHPLRGKSGGDEPDAEFYEQWASSPYADAYLTRLAEAAVDSLKLGQGRGTDFLAIGYSTLDHVGHAFGPRSHEVQDVMVRLDQDLGELFAHLDRKIGARSYIVALSADHGVAPTPEDLERTGVDSGLLRLPELQQRMEKALEPFNFGKPAVARIVDSNVYFAPEVYEKLKTEPKAMKAALDAAMSQTGVAEVFREEEVQGRPATSNPLQNAVADSYYAGRNGDLFVLPKPYWMMDPTPAGKARTYGTGHGVPYNYDQHVPVILMGFGIRQGEYPREVSPADIAPTLAYLCGITLASRDGHVLSEAVADGVR